MSDDAKRRIDGDAAEPTTRRAAIASLIEVPDMPDPKQPPAPADDQSPLVARDGSAVRRAAVGAAAVGGLGLGGALVMSGATSAAASSVDRMLPRDDRGAIDRGISQAVQGFNQALRNDSAASLRRPPTADDPTPAPPPSPHLTPIDAPSEHTASAWDHHTYKHRHKDDWLARHYDHQHGPQAHGEHHHDGTQHAPTHATHESPDADTSQHGSAWAHVETPHSSHDASGFHAHGGDYGAVDGHSNDHHEAPSAWSETSTSGHGQHDHGFTDPHTPYGGTDPYAPHDTGSESVDTHGSSWASHGYDPDPTHTSHDAYGSDHHDDALHDVHHDSFGDDH